MLNLIYNRLYNAFIWRWNLYINHPFFRWVDNRRVQEQRKDAIRIYTDIIERNPISSILNEFKHVKSYELQQILKKMNQYGYKKYIPLKKEPSVSIVMPHYNHQQYIGEALDSLVKQTVKPDEVIIIDDLSKDFDLLEKIVEKYKSSLPIRFERAERKLYCGPAKSYGASLAKGDIIIMHDADDISHPQRIEIVKLFFSKHPDCVQLSNEMLLFSGQFKGFDQDYNLSELEHNVLDNKSFIDRCREIFEFQLFSKRKKNGVYRAGSYGPYGCSGSSGGITLRKDVLKDFSYSSQEELRTAFTSWDDYEFCTYVFLSTLAVSAIKFPLYAYRTDSSTYIGSWSEN